MNLLKNIILLFSCLAVVTSCKKDDSKPLPNNVTLEVSKDKITADGKDVCNFIITADGIDVTSKADLFIDKSTTPMSEKIFKTDNEGEYEFYAKYNEKESNKIKVIATAKVVEITEVVLEASKYEIKNDNTDFCSFIVKVEGEDVTKDAEVFMEDSATPLSDKIFKSNTEGQYVFYAKYKDKTSAKIKINVTDGAVFEGTVKIGASKLEIIGNGTDRVEFFVLANGPKVAEQSKIYIDGESTPLDGLFFTSTKGGQYTFYAVYKGKKSDNSVVVNVKESGPNALPADPSPEDFSFNRKVLINFYTGVWCPQCPAGIKGAKDIEHDDTYKDKAVFAEIHGPDASQDPLFVSDCNSLIYTYGITSYPSFRFNFNKTKTGGSAGSYTQMLKRMIDEFGKGAAKVGLSAVVINDGSKLTVKVAAKASSNVKYRLGAFLLEDGITEGQKNASELTNAYNYNIHDNVLRAVYGNANATYTATDLTINANKTVEKEFAFDIFTGLKVENTKVVIYVVDPSNSENAVDNAIVCKVGEQVPFKYLTR